jgi:hypothetical protein
MFVEIEWAILALRKHKRSLASHRNSLSPAVQLPSEIIAHVFSLCVDPAINQKPWSTPTRIGFSQVCRAWREIALGHRFLWTTPDFRRPNLAREMLRRAGSAPLRVDFSTDNIHSRYAAPARAVLRTALERLGTIRFLAFRGPNDALHAVRDLLAVPAPQLEELRLESAERGLAVLDAAFLAGAAPRLRVLDLCRYGLVWGSGLFTGLAELTISHEFSPAKIVLPDLLATLASTPALARLYLHQSYSIATFKDAVPGARSTIDLPQMQEISLSDDMVCSTQLLQHLRLPSSVEISLTHPTLEGEPKASQAAFVTVFDFLAELPSMRADVPLSTLSLRTNEDGWLHLTAGTRPGVYPLTLEAQLDPWPAAPAFHDVFALALQHLPVDALGTLTVRVGDGPADGLFAAWRAALARLPRLHALRLEGADALWTFASAFEDAHARMGADAPLPVLERLDVRRTELDATRLSLAASGSQWPQALYWLLADALGARGRAGVQLPALVLDGCLCHREDEVRHALAGAGAPLYLQFGSEDAEYWDLHDADVSQRTEMDPDDDMEEEP